MIMCQPLQRSTQCRASNVKAEGYYNPHKLKIYYPPKVDPRVYIKHVEVSCMNRLFKGIGIRNNNGGLEFFCEEYMNKHHASASEYIDMLRKQKKAYEEEFETLGIELTRGNANIESWLNERSELEVQLQDISDSMQHLIMQGRTGQIAEEEKIRIRQQLKTENKKTTARMNHVKAEIDGFYKNQERHFLLSCILPELEEKIAVKEKELEIASTFTIEQPGLLTFPWIKGIVAKQVNLFADMFDYLAYVFLSTNPDAEKLPTLCDNIVLNDPRNFTDMLLSSVGYDHIYCFFPHTLLGKTIEKTILERFNSDRVMSLGDYYEGYATLYEYARTFEEFVPITSKI